MNQPLFFNDSAKEKQTRLDKDTFNYFLSGQMTAIEMKNYSKEVDDRCFFIVTHYEQAFGHQLDYYCYDNATETNPVGFFDIFSYNDGVAIESINRVTNEFDTLTIIPIAWFYSDLNSFFNEKFQQSAKEKAQKEEEQQKLLDSIAETQAYLNILHASIRSKLTAEELSSLSFLTAKEYIKNISVKNNPYDEIRNIVKKAKNLNINLSDAFKEFLKQNPQSEYRFNDWLLNVFKFN